MKNNNKIIIGLTGGIGSGKSTVAKIFEVYDYPVYYADDAAKNLLNTNITLKKKIIQLFGDEAYKNGDLNRTYIAEQVFKNNEKLTQLNALVHPAVANDFNFWKQKQSSRIIIKEAAILIETESYKQCNEIILVTAPENIRIKRVMLRDKVTETQVRERMAKQFPDEEKIKFATHIIRNDEQHSVLRQVAKIVSIWQQTYTL